MAKFSGLPLVAQGRRARMRGVECTTLDGTPFVVDLRLLSGEEEEAASAAACAKSRELGGTAKDDDLAYQFAFAVEVATRAAVDPESPDDAPERFFSSAAEVRGNLDRERIILLAELQRRFQESVSPRKSAALSDEDFIALVATTAAAEEGEELPFEKLPQRTLRSFVRRMALQLSISAMPRSPTSSGDAAAAGD